MNTTVKISARTWQDYRARTFRLRPGLRLRSADDAVAYVEERGFVYFWPIKGVDLPSLWVAVAGERPVADAHDDPGHVTWGWKDSLLGARRWFYAKLLRGKATMVSLDTLPHFYALSENYGSPDDYLLQYEAGRLTQEAKTLFETLVDKGPLDSVALRREVRMTSRDSNSRFERALTELQAGLRILPVGVARAGAWRYAFIYDLVDRHFPDLAERARPIGRREARAHLLDLYLRSVGAARRAQVAQLFRWKPGEVEQAVDTLLAQGRVQWAQPAGMDEADWLATQALLERRAGV